MRAHSHLHCIDLFWCRLQDTHGDTFRFQAVMDFLQGSPTGIALTRLLADKSLFCAVKNCVWGRMAVDTATLTRRQLSLPW
jgi:hypothetical protein